MQRLVRECEMVYMTAMERFRRRTHRLWYTGTRGVVTHLLGYETTL